MLLAAASRAYSGPYPTWQAPTAEACRLVAERLAAVHGWPSARRQQGPQVGCEERRSVLDSLVRTLLSQNTTDVNSGKAFAQLKQRFPRWEAVQQAPLADLIDAIRVGGLAETKATRIQAILGTLAAERGELSMEYLRQMEGEEVKAELGRFKGVGKKTIACVLLFALQIDDFAVDTHVWELAKALGWCPVNASRDQTYLHLNQLVPDDLKYDLHVLFVTHGKRCPSCSKQGLGLVLPSKAGSAKPKAAAAASGAAVECPLADLKPLPGQLKSASPARQRGSKAAGGGKQPSVKAAAGGEAAAGGRKRRKVAAADAKLCD